MGCPASPSRTRTASLEVGVAYTIVNVDPSTPEGLLAALTNVELVPGRASYIVPNPHPVAKIVNRARGNGRVPASPRTARVPAHE